MQLGVPMTGGQRTLEYCLVPQSNAHVQSLRRVTRPYNYCLEHLCKLQLNMAAEWHNIVTSLLTLLWAVRALDGLPYLGTLACPRLGLCLTRKPKWCGRHQSWEKILKSKNTCLVQATNFLIKTILIKGYVYRDCSVTMGLVNNSNGYYYYRASRAAGMLIKDTRASYIWDSRFAWRESASFPLTTLTGTEAPAQASEAWPSKPFTESTTWKTWLPNCLPGGWAAKPMPFELQLFSVIVKKS